MTKEQKIIASVLVVVAIGLALNLSLDVSGQDPWPPSPQRVDPMQEMERLQASERIRHELAAISAALRDQQALASSPDELLHVMFTRVLETRGEVGQLRLELAEHALESAKLWAVLLERVPEDLVVQVAQSRLDLAEYTVEATAQRMILFNHLDANHQTTLKMIESQVGEDAQRRRLFEDAGFSPEPLLPPPPGFVIDDDDANERAMRKLFDELRAREKQEAKDDDTDHLDKLFDQVRAAEKKKEAQDDG